MSKRRDPFADREADRYDRPIASREHITETLKAAPGPQNFDEIAELLAIRDEESLEALRRRLRAMQRDGQIVSNRRGAYGVVDKMNLVSGRVQGHRDGFGFVIRSDGDDIYLDGRQMSAVFDGDEVLVRITGEDRRGRPEGRIAQVLVHNTQQLVGRYYAEDGVGRVVPDSPRISHEVLIPAGQSGGAQSEQYVLVEITRQPEWRNAPRGRVLEVLGDHMAPGLETDLAIHTYQIPNVWPEAVLEESKALDKAVTAADCEGRVDLRHLPLVTIDGEDAKDFDDAVYCEPKKGGGWRLWVAIADVSHYVQPGSALDDEAHERATSVYFPGRVVPMLPEVLSNGLCSLKPEVDRLCMVCEMTIAASGKLSGYEFYEGVMHSKARLTYTTVAAILDPAVESHDKWRSRHQALVPHLEDLHRLYKALRKAREARGAIDFETVETRVVFGPNRKIDSIVPVERNDAHKLIEECMLVANVATARLLEKSRLPALYRVHDGPREQKLESLRKFLAGIGIDLRGGDKPSPADYQAVLEATAGRPDAHVIQTVMLRSLSQAVYQPDNRGHFGLNYPAYAHFTSPIRRYPDLLVHRAIRSLLLTSKGFMGLFTGTKGVRQVRGARRIKPAQSYPYTLEAMQALGEHCSQCERRADEATRDVMAWLKCEYLQDRVGDEFSGVITAVTSFGLFVELKDIYVEGLVHVSSLGQDYFQFDAAHHRLVGERTRKVYRLGDAIRVRVVRVSLDERKIDLEAVLPASTGKAADKSSSRGGRRGAGGKGGDAKSSKAEQGVVSDKTGAEQGEKSARPRRRSARGRRR